MRESFLLKVVRALVPASATTFHGDGLVGCVWIRGGDFIYVAFESDGSPLCGRLRGYLARHPDGEVTAGFERRPGHRLDLSALMRGEPLPVGQRSADAVILGMLARLAGAVDGDLVESMLARGVEPSAAAYAFVTGVPGRRGGRVGLCAHYPWAGAVLAAASASGAIPASRWEGDGGDPVSLVSDACLAASDVLGIPLDPMHVISFVEAIGGAGLPAYLVDDLPRILSSLYDLPHEEVLPIGATPADAKAMVCMLALSRCYANATGRTVRGVIPDCGTEWLAGLKALTERLRIHWHEGYPEEDDHGYGGPRDGEDEDEHDGVIALPCLVAENIVQHVNDMVGSFETQVVVPAMIEADPGLRDALSKRRGRAPHWFGGQPWIDGDAEALRATSAGIALRLLARDKFLGGFLEEVRSWHVNQARIADKALLISGDVSWIEAFPPWKAPNGLTITCLRTGHELRREGAAMRNCVASYLDRWSAARCVVAAIRDGEGSVATLEIGMAEGDPFVSQLAGPANVPASQPARAAADALMEAIRQGTVPFAFGAIDAEATVVDPLTYAGHFAEMRDAWSAHIARGLRAAGPAELLASADPVAPSPRRRKDAAAGAGRRQRPSA